MENVDLFGVAAVITACGALMGTVTATFMALRTLSRVEKGVHEVHKEVTTLNGQTIAMLADATESRRIDLIPEEERTPTEVGHIEEFGSDPH